MNPNPRSDSSQPLVKSDLLKFNGDFQILSVDSSSVKLDYAFTYKSILNFKKLPDENAYLNLTVIDDTHLKATLFAGNKVVKSKTVKGFMSRNFFEFRTCRFSWRYIFLVYRQQTNRISLSMKKDLYLDTNSGGVGFLFILPVLLSGSSVATYDVQFKRK